MLSLFGGDMLLSSLFFQLSLLEGALSLRSVSCTSLIQWSSNILTVTYKQKICNLYGRRLKQNAAGMHFNYEIRYTVPKGVPLVQLSDVTADLMEFLDPKGPSSDFLRRATGLVVDRPNQNISRKPPKCHLVDAETVSLERGVRKKQRFLMYWQRNKVCSIRSSC